ncbi:MAG: hypothetical protein KGI27_13290, partial [Thaumarchaeota archaeon]|nr:hypothetical protein [Nitrososphaerota archaeon]
TYDGSSTPAGIVIYFDNVSQSLTTIVNNLTASILNNNNVVIGANGDVTNPFTGQIDDLRIYNRALSTSDVTDLYNNPAPMKSVLYDKSYSGPLSPTTCIYVPYITSNQYTLTAQQTTSTYYKTINGELYSVT